MSRDLINVLKASSKELRAAAEGNESIVSYIEGLEARVEHVSKAENCVAAIRNALTVWNVGDDSAFKMLSAALKEYDNG